MIATAISITKYENEAAAPAEEKEEKVDDDDDDDNDSVEKAAGAHNTRAEAAEGGGGGGSGPTYLLAKTQSILRKIRFPERRARAGFPFPLSFANHLPPSPPFVMD